MRLFNNGWWNVVPLLSSALDWASRRSTQVVLAIAAFLVTLVVLADVLFDSEQLGLIGCEDETCSAQSANSLTNIIVGAPFTATEAWEVEGFELVGLQNGVSFTTSLWAANDDGSPGALLYSGQGPLTVPGAACDAACMTGLIEKGRLQYEGDLGVAQTLQPGSYFLGIQENSGARWSVSHTEGSIWYRVGGQWQLTNNGPIGKLAVNIIGSTITAGGNIPTPLPGGSGQISDLPEILRGLNGADVGQLGHPLHFYNQSVRNAAVSPDSDRVIAYLSAAEKHILGDSSVELDAPTPIGNNCSFINPSNIQLGTQGDCAGQEAEMFVGLILGKSDRGESFGFNVHLANSNTPSFVNEPRTTANGYSEEQVFGIMSDRVPMPWMAPWAIQSNPGAQCGGPDPLGEGNTTEEGDCHCQVYNQSTGVLTESWRCYGPGLPPGNSEFGATLFSAGNTGQWDLTTNPLRRLQGVPASSDLEGFGCTGPFAYGGPATPLNVTPDEVKYGRVNHALWGNTLNAFFEGDTFVKITQATGGGTHNPTATTSTVNWLPGANFDAGDAFDADTMRQLVYGSRMRLKAGSCALSPSAPLYVRVLVDALEEYGFIMGDGSTGGSLQFGLSNDRFSQARWSEDPVGDVRPLALEEFCNQGQPTQGSARGIGWGDMELISTYDDLGSMQNLQCNRTPILEF